MNNKSEWKRSLKYLNNSDLNFGVTFLVSHGVYFRTVILVAMIKSFKSKNDFMIRAF